MGRKEESKGVKPEGNNMFNKRNKGEEKKKIKEEN